MNEIRKQYLSSITLEKLATEDFLDECWEGHEDPNWIKKIRKVLKETVNELINDENNRSEILSKAMKSLNRLEVYYADTESRDYLWYDVEDIAYAAKQAGRLDELYKELFNF